MLAPIEIFANLALESITPTMHKTKRVVLFIFISYCERFVSVVTVVVTLMTKNLMQVESFHSLL